MFFFKQKTAYEILACLEFRRVLFRSTGRGPLPDADPAHRAAGRDRPPRRGRAAQPLQAAPARPGADRQRISRRAVPPGRKSDVKGKSVDLGGRRILKKKSNIKNLLPK